MMQSTTFHSFPLLMPGQALKYITLNEALSAIDAILHLNVTDQSAQPPTSPDEEARYLISPGASGVWNGRDNQIAQYKQSQGWQFVSPERGWRCWVEAQDQLQVFTGEGWHVPSGALAVVKLGVQTDADAVNRLAVASPECLFTHAADGADHRFTINKKEPSDTSSVVFKTGFSGHGEIGLLGSNALGLKTSDDGVNWQVGMELNSKTGQAAFPNGTHGVQLMPQTDEQAYKYGPPNRVTTSYNTSEISVAKDRVYFCPVFVDRPVEVKGGLLVQSRAAIEAEATVRTGLFHLEGLTSSGWSIGALIADFGAFSADIGEKTPQLSEAVTLSPGWYACAVLTDGTDVRFKCARWMTPGQLQYESQGSGSSLDLRVTGASTLLYANGHGSLVTEGFPANWTGSAVQDASANYHYTRQMFIPEWRERQ